MLKNKTFLNVFARHLDIADLIAPFLLNIMVQD